MLLCIALHPNEEKRNCPHLQEIYTKLHKATKTKRNKITTPNFEHFLKPQGLDFLPYRIPSGLPTRPQQKHSI